jgi:hypothetical protein
MARAPTLYYKSLWTEPTLLKRSKISVRPYVRIITYKTLVSPALKYLGDCRREYTTLLLTKQYFYGVLSETTPLFKQLSTLHIYLCLNGLISYLIVRFPY